MINYSVIEGTHKNPNEINLGYSEPYRNFIFIDDMMSAWHTVINGHEKCNDGKIFTIGPDAPIKIKDYVDMIAKKVGWTGKVNWNTKPKRPGEIYWLNSNNKLLTDTLGWEPKTSLSEGVDQTIEILKKKYD